jgi:hypothetical protein
MANLQALLDSITALEYVVDIQFVRDSNEGKTKEYKVWLKPQDSIYEQNILVHLKDETLPTEEATLYNPNVIFYPSTPFKDTIDAAIPAFLIANPLIEKLIQIYLDETNKVAEYYMWVKEPDPSSISVKKRYVVMDVSGVLQLREVNTYFAIDDIARGIAEIIEHGMGVQ